MGMVALILLPLMSVAQDSIELPPMKVESTPRYFPDSPVIDRKIVAGKKMSVIKKSDLATTPNNQYRQLLSEVPGLVVSEVNNESFASLTYRGLGDPHESFNILMLRNGIASAPDPYGYPAGYYSPPAEAIASLEFYRGGAGLLYGPQPGGALNYKLRRAPIGPFGVHGMTKNLGGSYGQYSSYTEVAQGGQAFGLLGSLHVRGAHGPRESNSDSRILNPRLNLRWSFDNTSRVFLDFDYFQGRFGEPGGLARQAGSGVAAIGDDRKRTTTPNDRFEADRTGVVLTWEKDWSASSGLEASVWSTEFLRNSYRQKSGTAPAFGGLVNGSGNTIQAQKFNTLGVDVRWLRKYDLLGHEQHVTVAATVSETRSPYTTKDGADPTARSGDLTRKVQRETQARSVSIEHAFKFARLTLTPGARYDSITQKLNDEFNSNPAAVIKTARETQHVFLLGLGFEYRWKPALASYANWSQGYKPPSFTDTMPLGTTDVVSEDIEAAKTVSRELGLRGSYFGVEADVSLFQVDYSNQFGRVGNRFQNVGESKSEGVDVFVTNKPIYGLSGFASASFLKARFIGGPFEGKTPQYAPAQTYRAGLTYAYVEKSNVRLQVQYNSSHFGDDGNTDNFVLDEATVWDLSGEQHLPPFLGFDDLRLNYGVQNLLDRETPSRVRSNGLEPFQRRSLYAGLAVNF